VNEGEVQAKSKGTGSSGRQKAQTNLATGMVFRKRRGIIKRLRGTRAFNLGNRNPRKSGSAS